MPARRKCRRSVNFATFHSQAGPRFGGDMVNIVLYFLDSSLLRLVVYPGRPLPRLVTYPISRSGVYSGAGRHVNFRS